MGGKYQLTGGLSIKVEKVLNRQHLFYLLICRGDRTRTCDSLVPNQERYQLRYAPLFI